MADNGNPQVQSAERRDFLKKAGKAAVAAPALALILKAEKAKAWSRDMYGSDCKDGGSYTFFHR